MKAVALTGTPGTGKSSVASVLRKRGYDVKEVMELVREIGLPSGYSRRDDCLVVDTDELTERTASFWSEGDGITVVEGHLAHFASCSMAVVLRCSPSKLFTRLEKRGWEHSKVLDNVRSEVLDVILIESTERIKCIHELDTSNTTAGQTADEVEMIIKGRHSSPPLKSRWRGEIEKWF
jgi:adenylate kinase